MRGYFNKAEKTAETLHTDGDGVWLRTGDIGELDADGFLRITDRKKISSRPRAESTSRPRSSKARSSRPARPSSARWWCTATDATSARRSSRSTPRRSTSGATTTTFLVRPCGNSCRTTRCEVEVQAAVDELNGDLASYETIKKFILLQEDFSIEEGELTPSMKVKRKAVEKKYADALDALYGGALEQV